MTRDFQFRAGSEAARRPGLISALVKRGVAAGILPTVLFWGAILENPGPIQAQQPAYGAPQARIVRFGKTYINLNQVTHVISDPDPALPPGSLQVCFGPHTLLLHGEDADSFRRVLDEGVVVREAYQPRPASGSAAAAAPTAAATPTRTATPKGSPPAASGVAKKPPVRRAIQNDNDVP